MKTHFHLISCLACHAVGMGIALFASVTLHAQVAGRLDPTFAPDVTGEYVLATALQPDGKILMGGVFTSVNGKSRNRIARLHADGTLEDPATFNPGTGVGGYGVGCIAVQPDGKIPTTID